MALVRWKVFYTDSFDIREIKSFTNEECKPEEVPGFGILGIIIEDDLTGRHIATGDYYVYDDVAFGGWCSVDRTGYIDYVGNAKKQVIIKFGRNVSDELWKDFQDLMETDPYLPRKSAWKAHENRIR